MYFFIVKTETETAALHTGKQTLGLSQLYVCVLYYLKQSGESYIFFICMSTTVEIQKNPTGFPTVIWMNLLLIACRCFIRM